MILAEPALEASAPTPPPLTDPDDDVTSPVLILPTPPMGDADADAPWSSNAAGPGGSVTSLADARLRRSKMVATGASIVAAAAILVAVVGFTRSSAPDQTASPTSNTTVAGAVIVEDEGVVLKATATGLFVPLSLTTSATPLMRRMMSFALT